MKVIRIDGAPANGEADKAEPELNVVAKAPAAQRAHELLLQAKEASLDHLAALQKTLAEARALSEAVVAEGDLYTPGLHEFAGRLAEELLWRSRTLEALTERQREAAHHGAKAGS